MIRFSFRHCSRRCPRARPASGWSPASASVAGPARSNSCNRASPTVCATPILRDGTRDTGCGLKAFRRELFLSLPYFDGLHRFLPALVRREGYEIGYVDVIDRPASPGESNYGMWDRLWVGILDLLGVWWLIRRRRQVPQVLEVKRNVG